VLSFQYGISSEDLITPTYSAPLAILTMAQVPFTKWLQFVLPIYLVLFAISLIAIVVAIPIGLRAARVAFPQGVRFRLGADEFTILLDPVGNPSDGLRVAKSIQAAVAKPFFVESRELRVAVSIGIALSTPSHQEQPRSSTVKNETKSKIRGRGRSVRSTRTLLACAVSRGDDSSILCCAAQAIEHLPRGQ
jgi:hypothetical protein